MSPDAQWNAEDLLNRRPIRRVELRAIKTFGRTEVGGRRDIIRNLDEHQATANSLNYFYSRAREIWRISRNFLESSLSEREMQHGGKRFTTLPYELP